jgi:hypothetical protein
MIGAVSNCHYGSDNERRSFPHETEQVFKFFAHAPSSLTYKARIFFNFESSNTGLFKDVDSARVFLAVSEA